MVLLIFCKHVGFLGYLQPIFVVNRGNFCSSAPSSASSSSAAPESDSNDPIQIDNPFKREDRQCVLCRMNITPDFKNARLLSQFQSAFTGRIYGRHITGLCKQKQKEVEKAIVKSQACGFMPVYHKSPEFNDDPKLYDPDRPLRPHPY